MLGSIRHSLQRAASGCDASPPPPPGLRFGPKRQCLKGALLACLYCPCRLRSAAQAAGAALSRHSQPPGSARGGSQPARQRAPALHRPPLPRPQVRQADGAEPRSLLPAAGCSRISAQSCPVRRPVMATSGAACAWACQDACVLGAAGRDAAGVAEQRGCAPNSPRPPGRNGTASPSRALLGPAPHKPRLSTQPAPVGLSACCSQAGLHLLGRPGAGHQPGGSGGAGLAVPPEAG